MAGPSTIRTESPSTRTPAWPVQVALSPTSIKQYVNCPHRVRLSYIERRKAPFVYNLFLEQGRIAHNLLAEIAHRHKHAKPQRSDDELHARAFNGMPKREFPSEDAHEAAAGDILRWVRYGAGYLDRDAEFLAIEKNGRRPLRLVDGIPLTILTRPDLILLRTSPDDGERFVEIIDYKTGSNNYIDEIPPVTMRYAFKSLFQSLTPDTLSLRMQFTYVWLQHRETHVIDLSPEYCESAWAEVTSVIDRVLTERDWPAQPSHLCGYCPFNGHQCTAFASWEPDSDGEW